MRQLAVNLTLILGLVACGGDNPPTRDCLARVWVPVESAARVVGSWDGWSELSEPAPYDASWKLARLELPAGEHGYLLDDRGERRLDPFNPLTTFAGEREVSLALVADCARPSFKLESSLIADGALRIETTFLAAADGEPFEVDTLRGRTLGGEPLWLIEADPKRGRVVWGGPARARGRTSVTLDGADRDGISAETLRVSGWPAGRKLDDEVLYQVVTDRFRADGGAPLSPPQTAGSRAGGTLDGVRAALDEGYFASLGATALWLSPVYLNPDEARAGLDGRLYEGYHGYWPLDTRRVDPRLGGEEALEDVVQLAHHGGLKVLLDVVPNHVYEDHPRYAEHRDDGWFHPPGCVCGTSECPWGGNIEHCWFTPYLPDVRWQEPAAARAAIDDVRFWMRRFDLDGVRLDAVPMMPRSASRRLAHELRTMTSPREATWLLGEVFTGPGALAHLTPYLGPAGLDSVFDFPLMWALQAAIADGSGSFEEVEALLSLEEEVLAGSGAVLARMLNNHDTVRFVSVAHGDAAGDPWDEPAEQPAAPEPYERVALGFAVLFTLPGVPVIYQGDEIGLAGAGDPDNRRVMPQERELSDAQRALRSTVEKLGAFRSCSAALRRGKREALMVDSGRYVYAREHEDERVVVALSREAVDTQVALELPGSWLDVVSGETLDVTGSLVIPARGFRLLLPPGSPCANPW